ncbi:autotransporter outer membrane beta-barrel domain-containing protein, partial [Lelliottia wanjuensis]|uniref:autotransporter outer membrane beta-barrel domain-containing protein n=1 Tax=Lelliottia wanjuensis TaxID=3050585 RepID=UPI0025504643
GILSSGADATLTVDSGAAVSGTTDGIRIAGADAALSISNGANVSGDTAIQLDNAATGTSLTVTDAILSGKTNALNIASNDAGSLTIIGSQVSGNVNTSSAVAQTINMSGSQWTGNATTVDGAGGMTLALIDGTAWTGDIVNNASGGDVNVDLTASSWEGAAAGNSNTAINVNLAEGSLWTNTAESNVSDIAMSGGSTLILDGGGITTGSLEGGVMPAALSSVAAVGSTVDTIYSSWNAATSKAYILSAGTATGTFQAGVTSNSSGAAGDMTGDTIVHVTDASAATFNSMQSDVGVYRYTSKTRTNADGSTDVYLAESDNIPPTPPTPPTPEHTLSTAAQSVVNTRAAAVNLWRDEEEALNLRMDNERRTGLSGTAPYNRGAWGSYYGGYHRQQMDQASTSYDQTNSGFMVGGDNRIAVRNGNVLVGFAAMRGFGNVNMHDLGSAGTDIDSYGLSIYASYRMDNGLFFDATVKGEHLKNDMDVVSTDGGRSHASYSNSGYGGSVKAGYHWQAVPAMWVEPYVKTSYIRYNGVNYTLDNGLHAKDDNYTSLRLEGGFNLGTALTLSNSTEIKPYLHVAAAGETENGNSMDINGVKIDDSTDGAKGIVGLGTDVKFTKALGAYAGANYSKGSDNEDPWQLNAGVTYTW